MKFAALAGLVVLVGVGAARAADAQTRKESAFGFSKGMSLKQAGAVAPLEKSQLQEGVYATKNPPKPFAPLALYAITIGRKSGVCGVVGFTQPMVAGSKEAEETVAKLFDLLAKRYGRWRLAEAAPFDTAWIDPQGPGTKVTLKQVGGEDNTVTVGVVYEFSNLSACRAENAEGL